uniref:Uncharacterized protein n=1 Tax=Romanomermis culicivorax TaxID=13658 RepID=A0A915L280_ROMCU
MDIVNLIDFLDQQDQIIPEESSDNIKAHDGIEPDMKPWVIKNRGRPRYLNFFNSVIAFLNDVAVCSMFAALIMASRIYRYTIWLFNIHQKPKIDGKDLNFFVRSAVEQVTSVSVCPHHNRHYSVKPGQISLCTSEATQLISGRETG